MHNIIHIQKKKISLSMKKGKEEQEKIWLISSFKGEEKGAGFTFFPPLKTKC